MDEIDDIKVTLANVRALAKDLPREPETLPWWTNDVWGAPAAVLRSELFGRGARGKRRVFEERSITCWKGDQITYTGWELDQADLDCWLQILHLAKDQALGENVYFTGREFLKAIGRKSSGNSHRWLRRSIRRLRACSVNFRLASGNRYEGQFVFDSKQVESTGHYCVRLNLEIAQLFDKAFVQLNQEKRKLLRSNLSKWLQGYVQSHRATPKQPHRVKIERIQELSGSQVKELWKFKQMLKNALLELRDGGILASFELPPRGLGVEWVRAESKNSGAK